MFIADAGATSTLISLSWFAPHSAWPSSMQFDTPQSAPSNMTFRFGKGNALPALGHPSIPCAPRAGGGAWMHKFLMSLATRFSLPTPFEERMLHWTSKTDTSHFGQFMCLHTSFAARMDIFFSRLPTPPNMNPKTPWRLPRICVVGPNWPLAKGLPDRKPPLRGP